MLSKKTLGITLVQLPTPFPHLLTSLYLQVFSAFSRISMSILSRCWYFRGQNFVIKWSQRVVIILLPSSKEAICRNVATPFLSSAAASSVTSSYNTIKGELCPQTSVREDTLDLSKLEFFSHIGTSVLKECMPQCQKFWEHLSCKKGLNLTTASSSGFSTAAARFIGLDWLIVRKGLLVHYI